MNEEVRYTLRNTFWSKDYTTGISALLYCIKNDTNSLDLDVKFYSEFIDDCWKPLLNSLKGLNANSAGNNNVLLSITEHLQTVDINDIESLCLSPLHAELNNNKKYYDIVNSTLNMYYSAYSKDLSAARESLVECERKAEMLRIQLQTVEGIIETNTPIKMSQAEHEVEKRNKRFDIVFPFVLDSRLKFEDEISLLDFLQDIKEKVPVIKSLISLPGFPNESIQGKSVIHAIKKTDNKLDTSLYNLDRIGQQLIDIKALEEYTVARKFSGTIIQKKSKFNQDAYYCWNEKIFQRNGLVLDDSSSSRVKKSYGSLEHDNENEPNFTNAISGWIRKVSKGNEGVTVTEQLLNNEDKFYEKCCKLEYSKVQIEKKIFDYSKRYAITTKECNDILSLSRLKYQKLCGKLVDIKPVTTMETTSMTQISTLGTTGFFKRDNSIAYRKWIREADSVKCIKLMFGSDVITDDIVQTIKLIFDHLQKMCDLEEESYKIFIQSWANELDLIRCTNLKREIMETFRQHDQGNYSTIKQFIDGTHINKFIINDWIGLLKLWLLELPDSLIPYDGMLDNISKNNLLILIEFAKHFQWLSTALKRQNDKGDISILFYNNFDIPLFHYFIRNSNKQDTNDVIKYSPIIYKLLLDETIINMTPPNVGIPHIEIQQEIAKETHTPTKKQTHSRTVSQSLQPIEFVPRVFKTSPINTASNTPAPAKRHSMLNGLLDAKEPDDNNTIVPVPVPNNISI